MGKIMKRSVESAHATAVDYIIWDDGMSGVGVRIFESGKRSHLFGLLDRVLNSQVTGAKPLQVHLQYIY